jgi:hypothetical protein
MTLFGVKRADEANGSKSQSEEKAQKVIIFFGLKRSDRLFIDTNRDDLLSDLSVQSDRRRPLSTV